MRKIAHKIFSSQYIKRYQILNRSQAYIPGFTASAPINVTNTSGAKKERKDSVFMLKSISSFPKQLPPNNKTLKKSHSLQKNHFFSGKQ